MAAESVLWAGFVLGSGRHAIRPGGRKYDKDGGTDCVEGSGVTRKKDSKKIVEAVMDDFDDFPFDDLDENSRNNTPEIMRRGYRVRVIEVNLMARLNMGTIM